jgi:hypothetical protein
MLIIYLGWGQEEIKGLPGSKSFVQPYTMPEVHSDNIAKPLVCQLMLYNYHHKSVILACHWSLARAMQLTVQEADEPTN